MVSTCERHSNFNKCLFYNFFLFVSRRLILLYYSSTNYIGETELYVVTMYFIFFFFSFPISVRVLVLFAKVLGLCVVFEFLHTFWFRSPDDPRPSSVTVDCQDGDTPESMRYVLHSVFGPNDWHRSQRLLFFELWPYPRFPM